MLKMSAHTSSHLVAIEMPRVKRRRLRLLLLGLLCLLLLGLLLLGLLCLLLRLRLRLQLVSRRYGGRHTLAGRSRAQRRGFAHHALQLLRGLLLRLDRLARDQGRRSHGSDRVSAEDQQGLPDQAAALAAAVETGGAGGG